MWNLITLDGCVEGTQHGDLYWHARAWGDELEQLSIEQLASADALLFGRVTYEMMAAYWPSAQGENAEIAEYMNGIPKIVASRTLERAEWQNSTLVKERVPEQVAGFKQRYAKDLYIFGSANLCATLMQHDLIDEYRIGIAPIVLGGGAPLFKTGIPRTNMTLIEARPLKTGCVLLRYQPERQP
jgi:dihydrofolate reductase